MFSDYGAPSSNPELVRRLVSPLAAARLEQELLHSGKRWADQPVKVSAERYLVQVPSHHPAAGYGLLVFVPPWQDARIPQGWAEVLNDLGVIYVSAARSGNEESVLGRREPLALLAAYNIMRRYAVDPERVYVAGFSGGSRVALRLVLGYPDLFRGAILNAGSDPIGNADIPLPPKDLLLRFQSSVHLVYVTGERDEPHVSDDLLSVRSMRHWCMYNVTSFLQPRTDHEVAAPVALSRALSSLAGSAPPDPAALAACQRQGPEGPCAEAAEKRGRTLRWPGSAAYRRTGLAILTGHVVFRAPSGYRPSAGQAPRRESGQSCGFSNTGSSHVE